MQVRVGTICGLVHHWIWAAAGEKAQIEDGRCGRSRQRSDGKTHGDLPVQLINVLKY